MTQENLLLVKFENWTKALGKVCKEENKEDNVSNIVEEDENVEEFEAEEHKTVKPAGGGSTIVGPAVSGHAVQAGA